MTDSTHYVPSDRSSLIDLVLTSAPSQMSAFHLLIIIMPDLTILGCFSPSIGSLLAHLTLKDITYPEERFGIMTMPTLLCYRQRLRQQTGIPNWNSIYFEDINFFSIIGNRHLWKLVFPRRSFLIENVISHG